MSSNDHYSETAGQEERNVEERKEGETKEKN